MHFRNSYFRSNKANLNLTALVERKEETFTVECLGYICLQPRFARIILHSHTSAYGLTTTEHIRPISPLSIVQISAMENNPEHDLPVRLMDRFVLAYETVDPQP